MALGSWTCFTAEEFYNNGFIQSLFNISTFPDMRRKCWVQRGNTKASMEAALLGVWMLVCGNGKARAPA